MKRILITGANRGIGLEFTRQYLDRGEKVFAACRNPKDAAALHGLQATHGDRLSILPMEMGDNTSIQSGCDLLYQQTDALDILINNAGIPFSDSWEKSENLWTLDFEHVMDVFRVNAVGALILTQRCIDLLKKGKDARIANISSWQGSIGEKNIEFATCYAYSGSKAALNMFTRIMAQELAPFNILTVTINPGWVRTDMGGPNAFQGVEETVRDMLVLIDGLTPETSGRFKVYDDSRETAW